MSASKGFLARLLRAGAERVMSRERPPRGLPASFHREFHEFRRLSRLVPRRFRLTWNDRLPFLTDRTTATDFDRHYVYHTAWAARVLARLRPRRHVDISSSLYFVSIVSAFVEVDFRDYRPPELQLPNLAVGRADLLHLPFEDLSVGSLSCMHVVEHIGLGRYGDPLDPEADLKAMRELQRVVAPRGSLLFVVPVGAPAICFNAHRIYARRQIADAFGELELREFALIPESSSQGGLAVDPPDSLLSSQRYGCGCFWFQRRMGS